MILRTAELLVAPAVAGSEKGVVDPARGVLDHSEDGPPPIGDERVADRRNDPSDRHPSMLHRHEFPDVVGAERPGIDDLLPFRIDDLDRLALVNVRGFALARRNLDHAASPSGLSIDDPSGAC
jgi:hypothetical protein